MPGGGCFSLRAPRSVLVVLAVGLVPDDIEVGVELHIRLAAVVVRDFDLVHALLVLYLGVGDLAAAEVVERNGAGPVERGAGDGDVGTFGCVLGCILATAALPAIARPPPPAARARADAPTTRNLERFFMPTSQWFADEEPLYEARMR